VISAYRIDFCKMKVTRFQLMLIFCFLFIILAHTYWISSIAMASDGFYEDFTSSSLSSNWIIHSMHGTFSIDNSILNLRSADYNPWASVSIQRNCMPDDNGFTLRARVRNNGGFGVYFALFVSNQTFKVSKEGEENAQCTRNTIAVTHSYDAFRICRGTTPTAQHWSWNIIASAGTPGDWYILELKVSKVPYVVTANVYDDSDVLVGSGSITDMILQYSQISVCGLAVWRGVPPSDSLANYDVDWIEGENLILSIGDTSLSTLTFKNGVDIVSNIPLFDENKTVIETIHNVSTFEWILPRGTYFVQATTTYNEHDYTSNRSKVVLTENTQFVINFLFSNLTVSCTDTIDRPLKNCTVLLTRKDEKRTVYTDSSGVSILEVYYGNWTVETYWIDVPVGEEHITVNQSQTALYLQCIVGDFTVIAVSPFGNPVEADVSLTNEAYKVTLSDHHYTTQGNLTFRQIPLIPYNLTIT